MGIREETVTVRCRVQKYDPAVTEPPLQFIYLDEFECERPVDDRLGERFYLILHQQCAKLGHDFKCYSMSTSDRYEYDVVVYGEMLEERWIR